MKKASLTELLDLHSIGEGTAILLYDFQKNILPFCFQGAKKSYCRIQYSEYVIFIT